MHQAASEYNMKTQLAKRLTMNNILGTACLLFGSVLSYLRIESATQQVASTLQAYGSEAFGLLPAVGLAGARLLQDLALHHNSALAMLLGFLVSCWPVAISLVGVALLRDSLFASQPVYAASSYNSVSGDR
jgi:hypothetical protein